LEAPSLIDSDIAFLLAAAVFVAAIIGFVAAYGLRSYISYRRHRRFR